MHSASVSSLLLVSVLFIAVPTITENYLFSHGYFLHDVLSNNNEDMFVTKL